MKYCCNTSLVIHTAKICSCQKAPVNIHEHQFAACVNGKRHPHSCWLGHPSLPKRPMQDMPEPRVLRLSYPSAGFIQV